MKKTNKLISILLVMAMLLSLAPLSLTAFAAPGEITIHNSSSIFTNGNPVIIEAGTKAGYTKIKANGEYLDFSKYKYSDGELMFTLGNDKYEADLSGTDIKGAYDAYTGDINITMNGGVVDYISGSCAGMTGPVLNGNINITINGGQLKEIWGAEYGVNGNINITVTGGTITIGIYVLYRSDYTLNGDARVTVTGGSPGLIRLKYGFAGLNGKAHLYSSVMRDERINDFDNAVYLYGSTWKFFGDTAAALNGETLVIDADKSLTVANGKTFTGKVQNNGTVIVKNGGSFYASTKNYGTIYAYGNVSNIDNISPAKCIKKVTASGQNVTFNDSEWQSNTFNHCKDYTATLTPASGYTMPSSVTVKVGADTLAASDYTYDAKTGSLRIPSAKITDDTTVSALGLLDLSGSAVEVTLDRDQFIYNGEPISVKPKINGLYLDENNYTLEYSDNVNAGKGTVTITGKNSYTGSVTLEYTIYPASISGAEVTLADPLTYNGLEQTMKVESVVIDGKTFKEGVDYEVIDNMATYAGVYTLEVVGINNVQNSIPVEWEIKTRPVTVTADNMSKTYGTNDPANLTYSIDLPASYSLDGSLERDQGENVGVYLIREGTLTNENNPNYDITFVGGLFTIEPDVSAIEGLNVHNVESSDKAALEAVIDQIRNAETYHASEEKIAEWDLIKDNCVEMLRVIESVENHIESFENDLAKYDINTVTSDDAAELERFQNSVGKFYNDYYDNLTDEQIKKVTDIHGAIEDLETRISDVAEEITRITNAVNGYDEATVKYSDYKDILQLIDDIETLTTGKNITDYERAGLEELNTKANLLAAKIRSTADEISRITRAVNAYNIDTVNSSDKTDIENLIARIKKLTDGDNITADERANLNELDSTLDALLAKIDETADELARLEAEVGKYDEATVKSSDKTDLEQLKADIKTLTDGQNITADERAKLENLDATADALLAKIAETKSEYDRVIAAANGYDEATVTSADKDALVQLNDDIYALALTDNVTAEEKENLQAAHDKVLGLIDKLTAISDEIKRIIEAVDKYVFESVKSSDKADIEQLIADIKALLDTQNITADERALLEGADETCDKLIAKIDETVAEINRINDATNAYDEATVTSADKADIEKLLADIKVLTDGDNITDAEREQLNGNEATLKALLDKIGATADEIARIEKAVNGYDEESVKSSDKADLEQLKADIKALTDATNITEDERTKLGELDAKIDALIKKIDDTAAEIERIDEAVNGYDKETVTSDDIPELGKLIEDIKALTDGDNLTEEEKTALEETEKAIDDLVEKLAEVAEEIKRVDEAVKSYDEETVKSTDSEDLAQLKEDIQNLIDSTNTTENEKTALEEMIKDIEGLEEKITETEEKLEEIKNIENNFNPETVSSDDKAAIEEAITEIEAVNPDNLTDEQKAEYKEIKAGFEALLEEIAAAEKDVADIGVELEMFDEERVTKFREDDIEALKAKIDELLADENMGEAEKTKLNEYKAQAEKLIEIINTPKEYFSLRFFYLIWDCLTWKYNGILWLFKQIFAC